MADPKNTHCKWCAAINCTNSKNRRPDLSFFSFPKDTQRCKQWVINSKRLDLERKSPEQLYRSTVLCSEHFESCFFSKHKLKYTNRKTERRRLIKDAIPTIFDVPSPPPRERSFSVDEVDDIRPDSPEATSSSANSTSEQHTEVLDEQDIVVKLEPPDETDSQLSVHFESDGVSSSWSQHHNFLQQGSTDEAVQVEENKEPFHKEANTVEDTDTLDFKVEINEEFTDAKSDLTESESVESNVDMTHKSSSVLTAESSDTSSIIQGTHARSKPFEPLVNQGRRIRHDDCSLKFPVLRQKLKLNPYEGIISQRNFSSPTDPRSPETIPTEEKPLGCDETTGTWRLCTLYKCDLCDESFTVGSDLTKHRETHYMCDVCDKRFSSSQVLRQHKRVHTGEKPYKCEVCDKMFSQVSSLYRHKRVHTGEKPFKCDVCDKMFSERSQLNAHKKRVHTEEKRYKCDVCYITFPRTSSLKKHNRTMHARQKL